MSLDRVLGQALAGLVIVTGDRHHKIARHEGHHRGRTERLGLGLPQLWMKGEAGLIISVHLPHMEAVTVKIMTLIGGGLAQVVQQMRMGQNWQVGEGQAQPIQL